MSDDVDLDGRLDQGSAFPGRPSPDELAARTPSADPASRAAPYDPLRLCIFATVALLGWLGGPLAVIVFAALGFAGYWQARRAGLTRSQCYLRDTRLVLGYLAALVIAGVAGTWFGLFALRV